VLRRRRYVLMMVSASSVDAGVLRPAAQAQRPRIEWPRWTCHRRRWA